MCAMTTALRLQQPQRSGRTPGGQGSPQTSRQGPASPGIPAQAKLPAVPRARRQPSNQQHVDAAKVLPATRSLTTHLPRRDIDHDHPQFTCQHGLFGRLAMSAATPHAARLGAAATARHFKTPPAVPALGRVTRQPPYRQQQRHAAPMRTPLACRQAASFSSSAARPARNQVLDPYVPPLAVEGFVCIVKKNVARDAAPPPSDTARVTDM